MNVGIKPWRIGTLKLLEKLLFIPAFDDVVADVVGLRKCEDHDVMTASSRSLRTGGFGLLVPCFAMDDTRDMFARVLTNALPNAHHVPARCVHKNAAFGF